MLDTPPIQLFPMHIIQPPLSTLGLWTVGMDPGGSFWAGLGVRLFRWMCLRRTFRALQAPGFSAVLVLFLLRTLVWAVGPFYLVDLHCRS